MYPHKIEQATMFIIDVGRNVSTSDEKDQKSFFENARDFVTRLIERKIMSQGKTWVGVILLGSKNTVNNMAVQCEGAYKHIEVLSELGFPTWKMIRDLPETASKRKGDWVDALIVAADHFKSQADVKIANKKIILITNFLTPTNNSPKNVQIILDGFKEENFEVDVIGLDVCDVDDNLKGDDVALARQFVETTNGATANFECAMEYLSFHRKKAVNPMPWNVDLSIGPNISIPVSAFIRLRDEPIVKNWRVAVRDPVTQKSSTTEGVMKNKHYVNMDSETVGQVPEIIKGFHYGQKVIPFSDCDKSMLYESGEKCLSVYGFTSYCNINWQSLNGDGLSYVFGRKGDKKSQHAIRCLVECMHETKTVGIVRRVYNKNNAPKMFALFPVIDTSNYICLSLAAVCFKEDIKYMSFPSTNLKKYACTDAQVSAFKDYIKAMDLTRCYDETYDDTEAFPVAQTVSPFAQYVLDCIAFRAMNPGKPLPKPREVITNLFKVPPEVESRAKEPLEKLKSLFELNKVEKKTRKRKIVHNLDDPAIDILMQAAADDIELDGVPRIKMPLMNPSNDEILRITTVDPISDFMKLRSKEKSLADLAPEITSAIEDMMYCCLDTKYEKPFNVMNFFRKECVDTDPSHYNNWLQKFKKALNDRKKDDVLGLIRERNVNFILKSENSLSTYEREDSHDDSQLYENDTVPNTGELTIQSDINDLFDKF